MTELSEYIQAIKVIDTHEHLSKEAEYVEQGPDVLNDLFANYVTTDLVVAGASQEAVNALLDRSNPDIEARWVGVQAAWRQCQHTGYGEAVRWIAKNVYGMDEITPAGIVAAGEMNQKLRQPGERLRILRDEGNYDHVQVDSFTWECAPDPSGLDFFLYDLSWVSFCNGEVDVARIYRHTQIEVTDLESLREAMAALFAKYAPYAIAVKTQHAYQRTLIWQNRDDADAAAVLDKHLRGAELSEGERLLLGDWGWARGVELATQYNLPFKMHTGYYAGHSYMPVERIKPGHLCGLLQHYPQARFVLMHMGYPYNDEMVAIAKHYPNVWVDMCWSWSIDPYSAANFVRQMIHTVPTNKLFAFGGDTFWPNASVAYSKQMRRWLNYALQGEVREGLLSESEAITLATRFLRSNQEACFNIQGLRDSLSATQQAVA